MRIVLTGGASGGHFYPLIAVGESIRELAREKKLIEPELFFFGPSPFDDRALYDTDIRFIRTPSGKIRKYFSILNYFGLITTFIGTIKTLWMLYLLFPDVIFSKGGYGSTPTLLAARILGIPVYIHDSDAIPGRATLFAAPFAKAILISYDEALQYFPTSLHTKIVLTGNPVRKDAQTVATQGAFEYLGLEASVPTVLFLGGSLGAEAINNVVLDALPELLNKYQVIHQTGEAHYALTDATSKVVLEKHNYRYRYHSFPYLNTLALKMSAGAADIVVSRAGSGSIAEFALWGKPAILIPIPAEVSRDQRLNAFAYARRGAAVVIEQENLAPHILVSEIDRILTDPTVRAELSENAKKFARPEAARAIAEQLLGVAISHQNT